MKGLYIRRANDALEKVSQKSTELRLLAKAEGTEIMVQEILAHKPFTLSPCDRRATMEFFLLLEGSIAGEVDSKQQTLKPGDYLQTRGLQEVVHFRTLTDVKLLYISTQPIFAEASKTISTLRSLVTQVETKDAYTHNHGKRVQEYTERIANAMGISGEQLEVLMYSALFHDVGKIKVPDEILNKPGRLNELEVASIKEHPVTSKGIVEHTFLSDIETIVAQHHERMDGSGYPYGLFGEEICLEARIIAVADVFDAMTSDRVYRKALTPEEAWQELHLNSGVLYDHEVVEAFARARIIEGMPRPAASE